MYFLGRPFYPKQLVQCRHNFINMCGGIRTLFYQYSINTANFSPLFFFNPQVLKPRTPGVKTVLRVSTLQMEWTALHGLSRSFWHKLVSVFHTNLYIEVAMCHSTTKAWLILRADLHLNVRILTKMMAQLKTFAVNASVNCIFAKSINSSHDWTFIWLSE